MNGFSRRAGLTSRSIACLLVVLVACGSFVASSAVAAGQSTAPGRSSQSPASPSGGGSLEAAASKAGEIGRKVAMSLIGLGFALAAIVLVFRRDFKEAAGVFAVGLTAVLLASPAGVGVVRDTVNTLFGS
jgi:hypothetical protein